MNPKTKDRVVAGLASRVLGGMTRDERIVRGLLDTSADSVPERLLLVATPFILKKACGRLKHTQSHGRVTTGVYKDSKVGIVDTGMGTPSAAMVVEAVVRTNPIVVVRADVCGGLGPSQKVGDAFVAAKALVGDGCGSSYFGLGTEVLSNLELSKYVVSRAEKHGLAVHTGTIWTTDILLGQTKELLEEWTAKGASAVDMESSVILGISTSSAVPSASLNCISDLPATGQGPFDSEKMEPAFFSGLDAVIDAGLESLIFWKPGKQLLGI
jgi:uridine phosphorylase